MMIAFSKMRGGSGSLICLALLVLAGCDTTKEEKPAIGISDQPLWSDPGLPVSPRFGSGMSDRIFFKLDSATITPEARTTLERIAAWARANPQAKLTVEGHCDDRGTREYNLALGERRAEAARDAEVALGVESGRLQTVSYGKERPAATGETEAAWAQNRRAVFVIQ